MKKVLAFGTFDILHPGHLDFFEQAKKLGDELHIVVARDETVQQVKGNLPDQNETTRAGHVAQSKAVDQVHLGYIEDKYKIIEEVRPDIIALGYDQNAFVDKLNDELQKRSIHASVIRLKPFHPELYKSSKLKEEQAN